MSTRQPPQRLAAILALLASALLVLALLLPMLVVSFTMPGLAGMTTTISAWGPAGGGPGMSGGALFGHMFTHAIPMLFATLLLVVATVIAFVRPGSAAGGPVTLWLVMAAAFASGVAITVVAQVTSWLAIYEPPFGDPMGMHSSASIGMGFWSLAAGAVLAVAAAALTAMPARKPEAAEVPLSPAAETTGAA